MTSERNKDKFDQYGSNAKESSSPFAEKLLAERVRQLSINIKAPLAPFVEKMADIGKNIISNKHQDWQLTSSLLFSQKDDIGLHSGTFTDLLLRGGVRGFVGESKKNKIIASAAGVDDFIESDYVARFMDCNLFLRVTLSWNKNHNKSKFDVYSCQKIFNDFDLKRIQDLSPDFIIVLPTDKVFPVPCPLPSKNDRWKEESIRYNKAVRYRKDLIENSILFAYANADSLNKNIKSEESDPKFTTTVKVIQPHGNPIPASINSVSESNWLDEHLETLNQNVISSKLGDLRTALGDREDLSFRPRSMIPGDPIDIINSFDPLGISEKLQLSRLSERIDEIRAQKGLKSDREHSLSSVGLNSKIDNLNRDLGINFGSFGGGWDP